jgi:hypothetical protein
LLARVRPGHGLDVSPVDFRRSLLGAVEPGFEDVGVVAQARPELVRELTAFFGREL